MRKSFESWRWRLSWASIAFGAATFNPSFYDGFFQTSAILGLAFHAAPLAAQLPRNRLLNYHGVCVGLFLLAQSLLSVLPERRFLTHSPYRRERVEIRGGVLHGFHGVSDISTDGKGFRTCGKVDYSKKSAIRIFALGASTTEEILHDDRETWTCLLEAALRRELGRPVEIVNTGFSGTRAPHQLATFERVLDYEPDLALFLVGVNDWVHDAKTRFSPLRFRLKALRERLFFEKTLLCRTLVRLRNSLRAGSSGALRIEGGEKLRRLRNALPSKTRVPYRPSRVSSSFSESLGRIGALCRERRIACVFLTQPNGYKDEAEAELRANFHIASLDDGHALDWDSLKYLAALYNGFIRDFARRDGHRLCDLDLGMAPSLENFVDDVHFTEAGSRAVARLLLPAVGDAIRERN